MFYAVTGGKHEGVYGSWPEAADACKGQSGAVPSKFKTEAEARQYLEGRQQQRASGKTLTPAHRPEADAASVTLADKIHPSTPAGLKRPHGEAFGSDRSLFYVGHSNMVNLTISRDGHASAQEGSESSLTLTIGTEAATAALNAPGVHEAILGAIKEGAVKHEVEIPPTLELRGLTAEKLEVEAVIPGQSDAATRRIGYEWVEKIVTVSNSGKQTQSVKLPPNKDAPEGGASGE